MDTAIVPLKESDSSAPPATPKPLRVLIVDDSENDAIILLRTLRQAGYQPIYERVWTAPAMQAALQNQEWEIVISDFHMPNFGGFEALALLKQTGSDIPFILVSAVISEETAVAAMKAGAQDYIMKRKMARLVPAIERELSEAKIRQARRVAEEALRQSEEKLQQAQKLEAVGRLAGGVAHDFNNILTVVAGYGELARRESRNQEPLHGYLTEIQQAAARATSLTRQLLTFSRRHPPQLKVIDLNDLLQNLEKMLRRLIGEDLEFSTRLPSTLWRIQVDPGQIEQVIMNLCVNARDAMPDGGRLTIEALNVPATQPLGFSPVGNAPRDYVMVAVTDTGTGMTDAVKARIFEPFFTTKAPGKGTGLGLATCYGIVQQSAGQIHVETKIGQGTTFRLYLPRVTAELTTAVAAPVVAAPLETIRGQTILLVEDEDVIRQLGSLILRQEGYQVLEAADGRAALDVAASCPTTIDLLFTDAILPKLSGRDVADDLTARRPQLKVIFTSGYTDEVTALAGRTERSVPFLQKPYTPTALIQKVREVLTAQPTGS